MSETISLRDRTPKNAVCLPPELWLKVFGYAAFAGQCTLARVARLSSGFKGPAEAELYRIPEILSTQAAQKFASAIRASPHRAGLVRGLRLGYPESQKTAYIFVVNDFLPELRRLHILDLSGFGDDVCVPEPAAFDLLVDPNGSKFSSLRRIRGLPLFLRPRLVTILTALPDLVELPVHAYVSLPDHIADDYEPLVLDIPKKFPSLRALSCPYSMLDGVTTPGNITSLCLSQVSRKEMGEVVNLFGPQLVRLRVQRQLKPERYAGMAYPTNWNHWLRFPRLRFLDVRDSGKRRCDSKTETIKAENLPPLLETLVWDPTWIADCALHDSRSEEWRRDRIRTFAETVLRGSAGLRTVVYHWRRDVSYQCALVGGREGRFCEFLADPTVQDEYAWADYRC
ncbi:hypothetical protein TRAPUB_12381 [Trametes pubescens]|uniref:F-box domain-containing protein n=1 Tax=Trametes pubescens TaxID=154538 RepID=A0A1M2VU18_TRAPU|nr:hypothetical protein TRAPUB_12381 [Trametes pubescens]